VYECLCAVNALLGFGIPDAAELIRTMQRNYRSTFKYANFWYKCHGVGWEKFDTPDESFLVARSNSRSVASCDMTCLPL
jgi:hypothetical protein